MVHEAQTYFLHIAVQSFDVKYHLLFTSTGTDFVRGTPRIGPHRMWELLPLVLRGYHKKGEKINIFKPSGGDDNENYVLDEDVVCDIIMYKLYCEVFSGHAPKSTPSKPTFQSLSKFIKSNECRLGNATKESFPTMEMMATTVRNISWNLAYWICASKCNMQDVPDPIQPSYGYAMDGKGKPQYLDVVFGCSQEPPPAKRRTPSPTSSPIPALFVP